MYVVHERCCGLDIHKKIILACILICTAQGLQRKTEAFGTTVPELLRLLAWLKAHECSHVAMESTGVFWKPIYNLLEGEVEILLVNAQQTKALPGRKTDVKDAEWIADLLQHGLLRGSFVPPRPQRELRELTRYRSSLIADRARLVNRMHKVLEDSNIKLTSVVTDITGVSGRAILTALLQGQQDPQMLAELARGRLRAKRDQLAQALQGTLREHQQVLLTNQLHHLDFLDRQIGELDREIAHRLGMDKDSQALPSSADQTSQEQVLGPVDLSVAEPLRPEQGESIPQADSLEPTAVCEQTGGIPQVSPSLESGEQPQTSLDPNEPLSAAEAIHLLDGVTGINQRIAEIVIAEIGTDMSRFPTEGHLASWVGLCPSANISAGKRLSGKTGKGNVWLRVALIQAAHGAARSKGTYLGAYYQRLSKRMGAKKAIVALAHRILIIIYHLLKDHQPYQERGPEYLEEKQAEAAKRWAIRRLEHLGYEVTLQSGEAA
ncbi:MAG TPA: IS110 family transposase [Ktedonobacteraceae bacterium]|jgi:transposase